MLNQELCSKVYDDKAMLVRTVSRSIHARKYDSGGILPAAVSRRKLGMQPTFVKDLLPESLCGLAMVWSRNYYVRVQYSAQEGRSMWSKSRHLIATCVISFRTASLHPNIRYT
jgi:hypothetical protein